MFQKAKVEEDDYTPQERLTAVMLEYKKLEAANQTSIERMYGALSSPFKLSNKPCEVPRAAFIECFERVLGKTGSDSNAGSSASSDFPPVHHCYNAVSQYESCVLEKTLAQHHSLVSSFETRRIEEAEMASLAAAELAKGRGPV